MRNRRISGGVLVLVGASLTVACGGQAHDSDGREAAQDGTAAQGGAPTTASGGKGTGGGTLECYPCYKLPTGVDAHSTVCALRSSVEFVVPPGDATTAYASMSYQACFNGDCTGFSGKEFAGDFLPTGGGRAGKFVRFPLHDYIQAHFLFDRLRASNGSSTPSYALHVEVTSFQNAELKNGDQWTLTILNADDSVFYQTSVTATYQTTHTWGAGDFASLQAFCTTLIVPLAQ